MASTVIASPVGSLRLQADDGGLTGIWFVGNGEPERGDLDSDPVLRAAAEQLAEYFAGRRTGFELPLAATGTPFQRAVWDALQEIPYGRTWSYADVALHIGNPRAVRAVGAANGRNPLPIVVPCHRVVGANGTLTGYGGGLENKRILLDLESGALARAESLT
ncbi:MAG TPA: methylated-DNA--[protein]-cysteine S-methyltransferase [Jatrophihabitantaceae bacterium]|jgi:methylated-DNA-[protein]-cysteine S-methyltransferase